MQLDILTKEDLRQFKTELMEELKQVLKPGDGPHLKKWLRSAEVRKLLNISPGTLQNLRIKGVIPFRKVGSIFYYPYDELVKVIEEGGLS